MYFMYSVNKKGEGIIPKGTTEIEKDAFGWGSGVKIILFAAITAAGLLTTGCKDKKDLPENYRDDRFVAMLNDSLCMAEEYRIQSQDSLPYTVAFYADLEQPVLWEEGGDTTLRRMADWYNARMVSNAVETDVDTWRRYSEEEVADLEKDMLDSWRKITFKGICDPMAKRRLKEAIEVSTEKTGDEEKRDIGDVADRLSTWMNDIDEACFDSCIEHISPKAYYKPVKTMPYDSLVGEDARSTDEVKEELYRSYLAQQDFDTRMAMLFMLMYAYYYDWSDTTMTLLRHAEEAFTSGNYSPMLPLVWRAYRVLYCTNYSCPSTYCDIPNVRFNYYRRLIAYTYLRHLERYPEDKAAKIQFYFLAYRENINRFGEYILGNQSAAEYISLFWNGSTI